MLIIVPSGKDSVYSRLDRSIRKALNVSSDRHDAIREDERNPIVSFEIIDEILHWRDDTKDKRFLPSLH